jgi:uncharacterized protein
MREDQEPVLEALRSPAAYPHATEKIRTIETHISWVFLTGRLAYKVKKAVKLPYVDFSTLDRRERACRDELSLNRRLAPALYHAVVSIGGDAGRLRIGAAPAVEFAVKMTQFPDTATADHLIRNDSLGPAEIAALAVTIARFHETLEPSSAGSAAERMLANLGELESELADERSAELLPTSAWMRKTLNRVGTALLRRTAEGRVRECHGDLHLGNIARIDGTLVPFDCLEFSRELRTIDVLDEVAFLFMDLCAHGRTDLAYAFLNPYLEGTGDYGGLRLLRLYAAHRALVRAKVALAAPDDSDGTGAQRARLYLDAAAASAEISEPLCVITAGYSGSGKTTIARRLAPCLHAVLIRSDVERKRLEGLAPDARTGSGIDEGIYRPDATRDTYGRLAEAAEAALKGGIDIIVDASFLDREKRERFRALAGRLGARFVIAHCEAPADVLRERIAARNRAHSDASEADLAVLAHQLETAGSFGADELPFLYTVDTEKKIDAKDLAHALREGSDQSSSTSY